MKSILTTVLFSFLFSSGIAQSFYRLHDRMLTFNSSGAFTANSVTSETPDSLTGNVCGGQKNMVQHNGIFYHVYHSSVDGDADIYLRTSTNGIQWTIPVTVNDDSLNATQIFASLVVIDSGSVQKVIVSWRDSRLGSNNVQYRVAVSTNGGSSFHPSVQISSHVDAPVNVLGNIAADAGGTIYATWFRDLGGSVSNTWFSRSTDGGYTWSPMSIAFNGNQFSEPCEIVARNSGEVMIVVSDDQFNKKNLIAVTSSDSGNTWTNHQFTQYTGFQEIMQYHSTMVDDSGVVHIVWTYEMNTIGLKILYARSNDFGLTWSVPVQVSDSGVNLMQTWNYNIEQWPSIVRSSNNRLYVTWSDERFDLINHNSNVYISSSSDNGSTWNIDMVVNTDTVVLYQAQVSVAVRSVFTNDEVLVTWVDNRADDITSVAQHPFASTAVSVYPNPFKETLHFSTADNQLHEILLYDATMKVLLRKSFFNKIEFTCATVPAGLYFYIISGSDGIVQTGKVVRIE